MLRSSSSSVVPPKLHKSTSNSIVNKALNGGLSSGPEAGLMPSKSTSVVSSLMTNGGGEVEKLPCEFCECMIPMYKLLSHQAECVNPTNVRVNGTASERTSSSSSSYRAYSSLRDSHREANVLKDTTAARENSVSRSSSMNAGSSSVVNKYLRPAPETPAASKYTSSSSTKGGSSIVSRYMSPQEPAAANNNHLPESPPSYEKQSYSNSSYMGRSAYLLQQQQEDNSKSERTEARSSYSSSKSAASAPGLYENDQDREGLRQMLSGLRRDPMDVEDDPDNNDGSFFPCEFCGDPYPSEFIMRHQVSMSLRFISLRQRKYF